MEQHSEKRNKRPSLPSIDGRSTRSSLTTISVEQLLEKIEETCAAAGKSAISNETAHDLGNLGQEFYSAGDYIQAASFLNEALTMYLKLENTEKEVVQIRNQLGLVYIAQGNFTYAEGSLSHALEDALENSAEQADAYYFLGLMHRAQQQYTEATPAFQKAMPIYEALNKQADVASMHYHLGLVYLAENEYDAAEEHLRQAVNGLITDGEDDDEMAEAYRHLGLVQQAKKQYPEALATFLKALDEYNTLDEKQYQTGLTHFNMGTVYLAQKLYPAAIASFNEALNAFGEDSEHVAVTEVQYHLGLAEKAQHNTDKALEHWNIALTQYIASNEDNKHRSKIEQILNCIGLAYQDQGNFEYAISSFDQILDLYSELPEGTVHITVANTHRRIGETHLAANDLQEANASLSEALRMFQILDQQNDMTAVQQLLNRINTAPRATIVVQQTIERSSALNTSGGSTSSNEQVEQQDCCAYLASCCGFFSGSTTKAPQRRSDHKADFDSTNPLVEHLNGDTPPDYGTATATLGGKNT